MRFHLDGVHSDTDSGLHGLGTTLEWYSSKLDHFYKRTHLVLDKRTDLQRIFQVLYKCKAYPYQFRAGFKRIRSCVTAAKVVDFQNFAIVFDCKCVNLDSDK